MNSNKIKTSQTFNLLEGAVNSQTVPDIVLNSLTLALELKSSDIHIQPEEKVVNIKFRIDGVLSDIITYDVSLHKSVVSRIKILSNLKIDETRVPQDGHANVMTTDGRPMDLRVSTLPTIKGEKIVMRLVDRSKDIPDLESLGMNPYNLQLLELALKNPNGVILTSGPTGSGKTTTLYAALKKLNTGSQNILTIEDPVEIPLIGTSQAQTKKEIGFTFASGLRAALRQDPDIIMVGEIRDKETLDTAIEASLTGHLVLSTIHTNSAIDTISRIQNMGIPNYLISSAVRCVIAQRLIRQVSSQYVEFKKPPKEIEDFIIGHLKGLPKLALDGVDLNDIKIAHKKPEVSDLDMYQGRIPIYEILNFDQDLKDIVSNSGSLKDISTKATQNGMVTLLQSGLIKVLQGKTTLTEVLRIVNS